MTEEWCVVTPTTHNQGMKDPWGKCIMECLPLLVDPLCAPFLVKHTILSFRSVPAALCVYVLLKVYFEFLFKMYNLWQCAHTHRGDIYINICDIICLRPFLWCTLKYNMYTAIILQLACWETTQLPHLLVKINTFQFQHLWRCLYMWVMIYTSSYYIAIHMLKNHPSYSPTSEMKIIDT